jgi:predicted TIM-barrel fold metal-dependent hydrolase
MIDVHIHVVPPNLPGVGPLRPLLEGPPAKLVAALRKEMAQASMTQVIAMGALPATAADPAGIRATLRLAQDVPGLHAVAVADPTRADAAHFRPIESAIATRQVVAIKVYLGYLHYPPDHAGYRPYYELAERHKIPVIFHTGDTYSPRAKLRFAHPLLVDDVAVDHPNVRFVLAHLGHPWLRDAAEVIYKNVNVWADLSGLAVGDAGDFESEERQEALQDTATAVRRAFLYAERPNRFLYGSDWPLVPMAFYRDFIRATLPETHHQLIFHDNARNLFHI